MPKRLSIACFLLAIIETIITDPAIARSQVNFQKIFGDGYTVEFPTDWEERRSPYSLGNHVRMFSKSGTRGGGGCNIQSGLNSKELTPELMAFTLEQRRVFFIDSDWGLDVWSRILPNLLSLTEFEIIIDVPILIGSPRLPARQLDYRFHSQGIYFQMRAIYTFDSKLQFMLGCMGFGLTAVDARNEFDAYLLAFVHAQNTIRLD